MNIIAELKTSDGEPISIIALNPKEFKTGSRGFFASTKAEIKNKRYQIQIQAVEIGSKKASEENK
jgi:hypothetical protein